MAAHTAHCICGKDSSVIVNGHSHTTAPTWQQWNDDNALPDGTGYYYLTKDITLDNTWKPANGTVFCLNGKTITADFDGAAITVQAPYDFTLTDCADTPGAVTHGTKNDGTKYNGRGVEVQCKTKDGGVGAGFNMFGGSISDNTWTKETFAQGGGVYVYKTFNISGAPVITGNTTAKGNANNYCYSDRAHILSAN